MYTSLKIVRVLQNGWKYYPNNSTTGFAISKGYFTIDDEKGTFQIVEYGKAKRPEVLVQNLTLQDLFLGEPEEPFISSEELQNRLVALGCPLAVDTVTGGTAGVNMVNGSNVDNTDPQNPVINPNTFQEVTDQSPITTQTIQVGGLTVTGKLNLITSLITAIRNVTLQDRDGTIAYLDDITALLDGLAWKQPVELNLDSGVLLSGSIPYITSLTQQGHTLVDNSRVILSGMANPIFNGFFRINATPISGQYRFYRTSDANTSAELTNAVCDVIYGTFADKAFRQTTANPIIGTSNIVFQDFGSSVAAATNLIAGIAKLYNAVGTETDGGITPNAVLLALTGKQNTLGFVNYASVTTTVGWSSFAQKILWYIDFNTHVFFFYHLEGPGNSINSSFTIHFNATENSTGMLIPMSNGTYFNNPGRAFISSGSNIVNLLATLPGSTWSAGASNKIASGLILIKK